jgi:hypothetical protein
MNKKAKKRILGLTQREFLILATMGGLVLCIMVLFGGYIIYDLNRPIPAAPPPTSMPQLIVQQTITPSPVPSTPISEITSTIAPTNTPVSTSSDLLGTYENPVPMGTDYTFPEFGTLTVVKSYWSPGQTGLAIAELSFTCELPAGQECRLQLAFRLDALGSTGNGYKQPFDATVPLPEFISLLNPPIFGGGTITGNVGFVITNEENFLLMRVQHFPDRVTYFFRISD